VTSPPKAANQISIALRAALGTDRFPIDVAAVAREFTKNEADPIEKIRGVNLDGFEGMLSPSKERPRWFILYNDNTPYPGRARFTQAHEFGHYKLHRTPLSERDYKGEPEERLAEREFSCNPLEPDKWHKREKEREEEADTFASYLLMPIDDYREQVGDAKISRNLIRHITNRYGVSLTAAVRKWIDFTEQRAAMVVARNGRVLWGRASAPALKTGIYIRSRMPIPGASIVARGSAACLQQDCPVQLPAGIWTLERADEPVSELSFVSHRLGLSITLLLYEGEGARFGTTEEHEADAYEHFARPSERPARNFR